MQYFDEQAGAGLREAFDALVGGWEEDVSTVTMFGCPCYRANGKVFAALTTDAVALTRLPEDVRAALEAERETEPFDRGWYAAPVGWIDAAGNGAFAVAIRSAVARPRRATLFAGVGLVADSDPDREWDEVQLKYRPILDELEDGAADPGEETETADGD